MTREDRKGVRGTRKQTAYTSPPWAKRVKKMLVDRDMTQKELAAALHCSYGALCQALSGQSIYPNIQEKAERYLGIRK